MSNVSVLFVDDEEDIRLGFRDRFEDEFDVHLAADGEEALELLRTGPRLHVVVTDIRMPRLDGLEMIRRAKPLDPDRGFIVVSGHGDTEDVITALRLGARNYLRKPYSFAELSEAVALEAHRYQVIQQEQLRRQREQTAEQFLVGVDGMTLLLPARLDLVNPVTFRLVQVMEAVGLATEDNRFNIAVAIMEILTNAIEHGSLGISGEHKRNLKAESDGAYHAELARRAALPEYARNRVRVTASIDAERAELVVADQGPGFDYWRLPDPTDPHQLFLPSGRGILLARTFLDDVVFSGQGNVVTLVKYRQNGSG